ncbi:MAG: glycosyltransferase family 2 protein, partial [Muribaculaceae bacterium]|nr:glycosyltransferase family 2 protein [Muribaculaceae bacterium]
MSGKNIKAMTMVRNDRFLPKWVEYYGSRLGRGNLYVFFDGEDQVAPDFCAGVNTRVLPKMQGDVVATDRQRSRFMSEFAAKLFADGADMVIATDADEFLVPDPATGKDLREFLSALPDHPCHSGLGVDVLQQIDSEGPVDFSRPFLEQRKRGWLYSRYTKPSVITRPLTWGGGYHRVKGTNFHIAKDLYLFHFGGVDRESLRQISADTTRVDNGWTRHQQKRQRAVERISRVKARAWEKTVDLVRLMQTICRPVFAPNKPTTFGLRFVVRIPERFKDLVSARETGSCIIRKHR